MSGGVFMVSRGIWDHPEFAPSEFSEREAFLWLVSEAAWKPRTVRAGRVVVDLERGQLCASVRFMAIAWGWSKSRVSRFLKRLEKRDMLEAQSGTGQLVVTLCNYDKFQTFRDASGTRAGQHPGHERDTSGTNENKGIKGKKEKQVSSSSGDDGGFADFWAIVPRKVGKGAAEKAYRRALKSTDSATIFAAMKAYAETRRGKDDQFTAHPATWLNGLRWEDDTGSSEQHEATDEYQSAFQEIERLEREAAFGKSEEGGGLRGLKIMDGRG